MNIEIQQTPNPNAYKFILPMRYFSAPLNFSDAGAAAEHPLASKLFALGTVYNVFLAQDFVTVNKYPDIQWDAVIDPVRIIIDSYLNRTP